MENYKIETYQMCPKLIVKGSSLKHFNTPNRHYQTLNNNNKIKSAKFRTTKGF